MTDFVTLEIETRARPGSGELHDETAAIKAAILGVGVGSYDRRKGEPFENGDLEEVIFHIITTPRSTTGKAAFVAAGIAFEELVGGIREKNLPEARATWGREWTAACAS